MRIIEIPGPKFSRLLFADTRFAIVWLAIRFYIGYEWLIAGLEKLGNPVWTGALAGTAVKGFLLGALQKTVGAHPDVSSWYAYLIQNFAIPNATIFSYLVVCGEIVVGVLLLLGLFTGPAALLGAFMNLNYLFAGTVSINPIMLVLQLFLILAWRTAGWFGLDHYLLPAIGTPWQVGRLFGRWK